MKISCVRILLDQRDPISYKLDIVRRPGTFTIDNLNKVIAVSDDQLFYFMRLPSKEPDNLIARRCLDIRDDEEVLGVFFSCMDLF